MWLKSWNLFCEEYKNFAGKEENAVFFSHNVFKKPLPEGR